MKARSALLLFVLCLTVTIGRSQTSPAGYARRWSVVDSLANKKGLTRSALTEVGRIYDLATSEHNTPQQLRALISRLWLETKTSEGQDTTSIRQLERATETAAQPARAILQSLTASKYLEYLQNNRYDIRGRTNTVRFRKTDIGTWTIDDLQRKIGSLYLASLKDESLLCRVKVGEFDPIIIPGNVRYLRPTLFDLLVHEALRYFMNGNGSPDIAGNGFLIDDPAAFADAGSFAAHVFVSKDSVSLPYHALLLYQRLIRRHLSDNRPEALIDVDIDRLKYVRENAVLENKLESYRAALGRITDRWGDAPFAAEAWYLQAALHEEKATGYDPLADESGRYELVAAKSICDRVMREQENSEGKADCSQLLARIETKTMQLQTEMVNLPDKPMLSLLTYRNIAGLYGRIVPASRAMIETLGDFDEDSCWRKLLHLPVLRAFSEPLPATGDFQTHRVELPLAGLPVGDYALIACSDSSFPVKKDWERPMSVLFFHVSSISFVSKGNDYFVLDRESGQPLGGATVRLWNRVYSHTTQRQVYVESGKYTTDEHGYFRINYRPGGYSYAYRLEISTSKDHVFLESTGYNSYSVDRSFSTDSERYERRARITYLFTDRSIYRPGQVLYFKGIVTTRDFGTRQPKILAGLHTRLYLHDVNGSKVDSVDVVTNEFGSYHGQFVLPQHLLNGDFSLRDDSTGAVDRFSVEEYKRPKFFVRYDTVKGLYRLGDSIRLGVYARAYAGSPIDGAKVKYTVSRGVSYSPWAPYRREAVSVVVHGEAKTDAEGRFVIRWRATPDRSIDSSASPVFEFVVVAEVTDIDGESHSGEDRVRAGYHAIELTIDVPAGKSLAADSFRKVVVRAGNFSGVDVPVMTDVAIYRLRAPERLIRERYWQAPDQFVLSKPEFVREFPHDAYGEETDVTRWARSEQVAGGRDSAGTGLAVGALAPGWYVIEAMAKGPDGDVVKTTRYVSLYDGGTGRPPRPMYHWGLSDGERVEPGSEARVAIGSSAENVHVIRTIDRRGTADLPGVYRFFNLGNQRREDKIAVNEEDRGGFSVVDVFVIDNRVYTHQYLVRVPWTNKELQVSYRSFRDKTLPGSAEKWEIHIEGMRKEKVAAEALSGMYDASLDQLQPHGWSVPELFPEYAGAGYWNGAAAFGNQASRDRNVGGPEGLDYDKEYDALLVPGEVVTVKYTEPRVVPDKLSVARLAPMAKFEGLVGAVRTVQVPDLQKDADGSRPIMMDSTVVAGEAGPVRGGEAPGAAPVIQTRKDFRETAFFLPDLRTDSAGNISFSFDMPEAVTSWKWMVLAHTRELAFGYGEKTVITQKDLMVQPNAPRFLREGDRMELPVKVINLTDSELTGQMNLELSDPTTGETADGWFTNRQANQYFTVGARQSAVVSFPIDIPYQYNRPVTYKVVASSGRYSDGEEATLPVVSNRLLVTESLPLNMPGDGTRQFSFEKLLQSGSSETLNHHALTVEFTTNPAWYAVQSLPYLMEYPHECSEQLFDRVYANALASHIVSGSPRLQQVFDRWRTADTAQLLSQLQKDSELKTVLLEETPWVMQGKSEEQQKKNIALLFDMSRMGRELGAAGDRLLGMQSPDGGFPWWAGGPDNRHITQLILTGIRRLQRMKAVPPGLTGRLDKIVAAALPYLDAQIKRDYDRERAAETRASKLKSPPIDELPSPVTVEYLYMRSFFADRGLPGTAFAAVNYYRKKMQKDWGRCSPYLQGMIALALYRTGDVQTAKDILASLKQNAIRNEERGMYWKGMDGGYYWWQAPVETQSLLIEAFHEISGDVTIDRDLKTWLLRQKQTHHWPTTTATADACYALLMGSGDWLNAERSVVVRLGDKTIDWPAGSGDAGTGYNKKVFDGPFVNPSMGKISVTMETKGVGAAAGGGPATVGAGGSGAARGGASPAWGAVYWQYFDMLDRITPAGGPKPALSVTKKLFIRRDTDRGPVLEPLEDNGELKAGDRVVARIEIRADRDLEYVHMKDMRAACFEPVDVISQYKWQDGLGYYESTKDASTDFFFDEMTRGTYVFEYEMLAGQSGDFSNGVTTIECLYAPEFTYHTEGIRVNVGGGQ